MNPVPFSIRTQRYIIYIRSSYYYVNSEIKRPLFMTCSDAHVHKKHAVRIFIRPAVKNTEQKND